MQSYEKIGHVLMNPLSLVHFVMVFPLAIAIAFSMIVLNSKFGWCCGGSGLNELFGASMAFVLPMSMVLTSLALKSSYRWKSCWLEHLRQAWILYAFFGLCLWNFFANVYGKLDSGEPGRALLIVIASTTAMSILVNALTVFALRNVTYAEVGAREHGPRGSKDTND